MQILILSIVLCLVSNAIRWAELVDNTTVYSFKDYINFNNKFTVKYNLLWWFITGLIYVMYNF